MLKYYTIKEIHDILINYIEHNKKFNEIEYINSIIAIEDLLSDIKKEYDKIINQKNYEFIDKQYDKMKKYIYNASEEELEEHYNWYQAEKGDKEDLLNIMFESYCNTYDGKELEERINDLLD